MEQLKLGNPPIYEVNIRLSPEMTRHNCSPEWRIETWDIDEAVEAFKIRTSKIKDKDYPVDFSYLAKLKPIKPPEWKNNE